MKKKSLVRQGYSAIRRGAAVCGGKDPEDVLQIRPAGNSPSGLSVAAAFCKGKNSQELNFPQVFSIRKKMSRVIYSLSFCRYSDCSQTTLSDIMEHH